MESALGLFRPGVDRRVCWIYPTPSLSFNDTFRPQARDRDLLVQYAFKMRGSYAPKAGCFLLYYCTDYDSLSRTSQVGYLFVPC